MLQPERFQQNCQAVLAVGGIHEYHKNKGANEKYVKRYNDLTLLLSRQGGTILSSNFLSGDCMGDVL